MPAGSQSPQPTWTRRERQSSPAATSRDVSAPPPRPAIARALLADDVPGPAEDAHAGGEQQAVARQAPANDLRRKAKQHLRGNDHDELRFDQPDWSGVLHDEAR